MSEEAIREALTEQLNRTLVPKVSYSEFVQIRGGFGMGLQDHGILGNGIQPVQTKDKNISLILDGELYNAEELKLLFRNELPHRSMSSPELCLHLIMRFGSEIVNQFNGLFVIVIYDHRVPKMTLISDRFGFRPLFYVQRQKAVIFGSELKALCVIDPEPRKIDEIGTLEFFCFGSQLNERTWLQEYRRLTPATILTVDSSGIRTHRYWVYRYQENGPTLDQCTYFTVFSKLLDRAVERCMRGSHRIGVFLSGGYDSRSMAASIRKHHLPIPAFTFGYPESRDIRYASMLADRLGLDHYPLTSRDPYLHRTCHAIVWRTEGMSSFANCTSIRYHSLMKEKMDIILLGFLAEFSGSHTWPRLLLARSRQTVVDLVFDRMLGRGLNTVRRVFKPSYFKRTFEDLRDCFRSSFHSIENNHPLDVADCWSFTNLQPRAAYHSPSVDRYLFEARAPHMDFDLVSFLLTIPPYSRIEQRVYKKMISY
ncbi:MAG: hypothetical protein JSU72_19785, partial [Deltaproteobacteria bacterium]